METPAVTAILATVATLTDAEVQRVLVKVNTLYAKRLADARRKAWASQGPAKLTIDSSRERT